MIVGKEECNGVDYKTYQGLKSSSLSSGSGHRNFENRTSQFDARKMKLQMQSNRSVALTVSV